MESETSRTFGMLVLSGTGPPAHRVVQFILGPGLATSVAAARNATGAHMASTAIQIV